MNESAWLALVAFLFGFISGAFAVAAVFGIRIQRRSRQPVQLGSVDQGQLERRYPVEQ